MKVVYIDCARGVSGQALLEALAGVGLDRAVLINKIHSYIEDDFNIYFKNINFENFTTSRFVFEVIDNKKSINAVKFIENIIDTHDDKNRVLKRTKTVLMKYIDAHSNLFNIPIEKVVANKAELIRMAAVSVGYFEALNQLKAQKVVSSPVPIITGNPNSLWPETIPLIMELVKGVKVKQGGNKNIVTALGAALLAVSVDNYDQMPEMFIDGAGYGVIVDKGVARYPLSVVVGNNEKETSLGSKKDSVMVIETNIDDMNTEFFPYLVERLLKEGALDAFLTPVYMKKGRPGTLLTVLCRKEKFKKILETIFEETTTLGVRVREEKRFELERSFFKVGTPYGEITIKAARSVKGGDLDLFSPEFEDCRKIAIKKGLPLKEIYAVARQAARDKFKNYTKDSKNVSRETFNK